MTVSKSVGRITLPFLLADLLTVSQTCQQICFFYSLCWQIYCHQICWQNWEVFLPEDLLTFTKSASRFTECHQICQQKWGVFLPADLLTFTKSASRFTDCQPNLPADLFLLQLLLADLLTFTKSASTNRGYFCQEIYWLSAKSAGLLTVAKSASKCVSSTASAGRITDFHQICQHK